MKPKHVTFQQAVALKEKDFDVPCYFFYDGGFVPYHTDMIHKKNFPCPNAEHYKTHYAAPEQWQVVEWVEQLNLYINITTEFYKEGVNFIWQVLEYDCTTDRCIVKKSSMSYGDNGEYKTREAAYSSAIDYILNNLL